MQFLKLQVNFLFIIFSSQGNVVLALLPVPHRKICFYVVNFQEIENLKIRKIKRPIRMINQLLRISKESNKG